MQQALQEASTVAGAFKDPLQISTLPMLALQRKFHVEGEPGSTYGYQAMQSATEAIHTDELGQVMLLHLFLII